MQRESRAASETHNQTDLNRLHSYAMADLSILSNLVAAIHDIRAEHSGNWTTSNLTAVEEVDEIVRLLLLLESQSEQFDNLELVKHLKSLFTGLVTAADSQKQQTDDSMDNISINDAARKTVFDTIRNETFGAISQAISNIENDEKALLQTSYLGLKASKKKKNDGYFTSFNFDDLPEYEHLESTLAVLRADLCSEIAIMKLSTMDQDELVEHPQWRELILLLRYSLYKGTESCIVLSLHLHLKLANFLPDYQAIDAVLNILNYFIDTWITAKPRDRIDSSYTNTSLGASDMLLSAEYEGKDVTLDQLTSCQLTVFTALMLTVSERIVQPSMEGDGDRAIASIFLLFAHAVIPVTGNIVHSVRCGTGRMPLIDAVALFTVEKGNFMMNIMRRRNPTAVVTLAVQSGLVGVLNRSLALAVKEFSCQQGGEGSIADLSGTVTNQSQQLAQYRGTTMRCLLYSKLLLSLLNPFLANAPLLGFCTRLLPPGDTWSPGTVEADTSLYLWDAVSSPRENARFKETWSTDILQSVGNSMVSMVANVEANKLIFQLSGARSLIEFFSDKEVPPPESFQSSKEEGYERAVCSPFDDMLLQLSCRLMQHWKCLRDEDGAVRSKKDLAAAETAAPGCPEAHSTTATASAVGGRMRCEASLEDILRLLTAHSVRSSLPLPHTTPASAFDSSAAAAAAPSSSSSSSSSSSQMAVRDRILSECASFCCVADAFSASNSRMHYIASFLVELEKSLVSASSQRSTSRSHKRAVLGSVSRCLVGVVEAHTHCTGPGTVDPVQVLDPMALSGIVRAWTAVLDVMACDSDVNTLDAADHSSVSALMDGGAGMSILKVVNSCLSLLGFPSDSPKTSNGVGLKEDALRVRLKSASPLGPLSTFHSHGMAPSSANSGAGSASGDRTVKADKCDKDAILDDISSSPSDLDAYSRIVIFFLSFLSSYSIIMPSTAPLALSNDDLLTGIISSICSSLLLSCKRKLSLRDKAIEMPSYSSSHIGAADTSSNATSSSQGKKSISSIPIFQDVFPLIEGLLSNELEMFTIALRVINSAEHSKEIKEILQKVEASSAVTESSECDISNTLSYSEYSTVTPLLFLLYGLARSTVPGAADSVIGLCAACWESLRVLQQRAQLTFVKLRLHEGKESSDIDTTEAASQLLAYVHVSGDLGGVETSSTGGFVIQLLYGVLHDDRICAVARDCVLQLGRNSTALAAEPTHTHGYRADDECLEDLSEYFSCPVCVSGSNDSSSMQIDDTNSDTQEPGPGPRPVTGGLSPTTSISSGDRGCDAPGWDLGSMFIAVLRYRLSCPLSGTFESSATIPHSLIPSSEGDLELIIAAVSSLQRA